MIEMGAETVEAPVVLSTTLSATPETFPVEVAVPEIAPVLELMERPAGKAVPSSETVQV